jgi:transposase
MAERLRVDAGDRRTLSGWVRAGTTPQRVSRRAQIVLMTADGLSVREIGRRLGVSPHTVSLWRRRYSAGGPAALRHDAPGRGRKASVVGPAAPRVRALLATPPPTGGWTVRRLAAAVGVSHASVHRVLKADRLAICLGVPDPKTPIAGCGQ